MRRRSVGGAFDCRRFVGFGEDDAEFVAAVAGDEIVL